METIKTNTITEKQNEAPRSTTLRWKSFPLKDDLPKSILAPIAVLGFSALAFFTGFGLYLSILTFIVLFISLMKYFVPTSYELTDEGVKTRFLGFEKEKNWNFFKNYYPHNIGVYLSTLEKPGPLDGFRGLMIRFNNNKEKVIEYIDGKIERN